MKHVAHVDRFRKRWQAQHVRVGSTSDTSRRQRLCACPLNKAICVWSTDRDPKGMAHATAGRAFQNCTLCPLMAQPCSLQAFPARFSSCATDKTDESSAQRVRAKADVSWTASNKVRRRGGINTNQFSGRKTRRPARHQGYRDEWTTAIVRESARGCERERAGEREGEREQKRERGIGLNWTGLFVEHCP